MIGANDRKLFALKTNLSHLRIQYAYASEELVMVKELVQCPLPGSRERLQACSPDMGLPSLPSSGLENRN
jgi:hypothetical protein